MMAKWCMLTGLIFSVAVLPGCRMMDSSYQSMTKLTNPDKMTLRGGVKWMNPHPPLREVSPPKMVAYLRIRNSSGGPVDTGILHARVREGLESAGYRVTSNIEEAQFTVRGDLRFYGENASNDAGAGMLSGAVIGGVGGAVAGHAIRHSDTSTGLGAAAGALLGGWFANMMGNRNKMVEIDLVMDLRIGERIEAGAVETTRRSDDAVRVQHRDDVAVVGGAQEGGAAKGGSSVEQEVRTEEDFLYHQNRLVAHAVKMRLTAEEAMPFLSDRVAAALSGVLP